MKANKVLTLALAALVAALVAGCGKQAMPEVNDENCEHIAKIIKDKEMQQEFSGLCLRRGTFKPSPPKSY